MTTPWKHQRDEKLKAAGLETAAAPTKKKVKKKAKKKAG